MPSILSATTSFLGTVHADSKLPRLGFTISFLGRIPEGLTVKNVPLQIAITVPHEYGVHTFPLIQLTPELPTVNDGVKKYSAADQDIIRETVSKYPPPFLPLPPTFQTSNRASWIQLHHDIVQWMLSCLIDRESKTWEWARNAYWIAFVRAHPEFLQGEWGMWDYRVGFDGRFIKQWIKQRAGIPDGWKGSADIVWEEMLARLRQHILFLL
ncbi:hypothetical protein C8Q80DRAFT_1116613 [Daedaleopsis nitida]|nr:hypothetical protein C8Q80DRAFT_1116613 [Daedaleopsis nitida]